MVGIMDDTGKVVLVTGGSRGIGAAVAKGAARDGYRVAVNYVSDENAANAVVAIIEQAGGEAFAVQGDVGSEADIMAMFEAVDARWGRLDALVNNAGVVDLAARLDEMSTARMERMMRINIIGSLLCAREAVKRMSTKHGGSGGAIVNLSSAAAKLGSPGMYLDYAASKGAIDTFTKGLALEVAAEGIRVNAVAPGFIETPMTAKMPDHIYNKMVERTPLRRAGKPEDIANAYLWLASDEASFVNGEVIRVDGGIVIGT